MNDRAHTRAVAAFLGEPFTTFARDLAERRARIEALDNTLTSLRARLEK